MRRLYEKIYKLRPTGSIAYQIARLYKKMGNDDKYLEWNASAMMYPEYETDFRLRYEIMQFHASKNNISKAEEFARETIKAADLVKDPSEDTRKHLAVARHDAYHVIGVNLYDQKQFDEAIEAFRKAIEADPDADGYYWIGMCEWEKKMVDEAIESVAKAEVLGGDIAPRPRRGWNSCTRRSQRHHHRDRQGVPEGQGGTGAFLNPKEKRGTEAAGGRKLSPAAFHLAGTRLLFLDEPVRRVEREIAASPTPRPENRSRDPGTTASFRALLRLLRA